MNVVLVVITSVTLLVILGSTYLEIRRKVKPRIGVYFPDGSARASYRAKEETNVAIHIKNSGRLGFPKPAATKMRVFLYAPRELLLKQIQHADGSSNRVLEAPAVGVFKDMHYLQIDGGMFLFHKEEDVVNVLLQMPASTGKRPLKVAILSDEGDLGIHELQIIVT